MESTNQALSEISSGPPQDQAPEDWSPAKSKALSQISLYIGLDKVYNCPDLATHLDKFTPNPSGFMRLSGTKWALIFNNKDKDEVLKLKKSSPTIQIGTLEARNNSYILSVT